MADVTKHLTDVRNAVDPFTNGRCQILDRKFFTYYLECFKRKKFTTQGLFMLLRGTSLIG